MEEAPANPAAEPYRPSICVICGRKALGYNYGVESCNACKMFFRRHTPESRYKPCMYNHRCYDEDGNFGCKSCRLDKCLRSGMKKLDASPEKQSASSTSTSSPNQTLAIAPSTVQKSVVTQVHIDSRVINQLKVLHKTRQEVYAVISVLEDPSLEDLAVQGSNLSRYKRPQYIIWELTERKLKPWGSLGMLLAVEMIKSMEFFCKLPQNDKLILLQRVAFKVHHLAIAFDSYIVNRKRVLTPFGDELFPSVLFCLSEVKKNIDELVTLPMEPLQELQVTEYEYLLINLIIVCNPALGGLTQIGQKILSDEQRNASRLLLQQCMLRNVEEGPARFVKMLGISEHLDKQHAAMRRLTDSLKSYNVDIPVPRVLREPCNIKD